jgi:uncharacterized protein
VDYWWVKVNEISKMKKKILVSKEEGKDKVKSPCVKKCSLDRNKICPACYRSIDEIVSWRDADDSLKRKILEAAKLRRAQVKE